MKFAKLLFPVLLAVSTHAVAQDAPSPNEVFIKNINASGSGCKDASTYAVNLSDDRKAFTVTFSEFIASIGPGVPLIESRKNCSITLTLNIPNGWQYSIGTFNYRGFMDLGQRIRAEHSTSYFFQGAGKTGTFAAVETGPLAKDFVYTDKIGLTTVYIPDTWSPCNLQRALTLNPSVRLSKLAGAAADAEGIISNDSVDGELKQTFGLVWRKCRS